MEGDMFHHNGGHNWAWYYWLIFKSYSVTKDKNIYISQQTLDIALDITPKTSPQQHGTLDLQDSITTEMFMATQPMFWTSYILLDWLIENDLHWQQFTYLNGLKLDIFWCQWILDWFYHLQYARDPNELKTDNSLLTFKRKRIYWMTFVS
jgi:hypothetical protein